MPAEQKLIREYWSKADVWKRRQVIRNYARLMQISEGRAEDALDLWVHLLATAGQYSSADVTTGIQ